MEKVRITVYFILVLGTTLLTFLVGDNEYRFLETFLMFVISAIFFAPFFLGWNDEKKYRKDENI